MATALVRHPAVAGRFYPSDPEALRGEVHTYLSQTPTQKAIRALGCIAPHAGYMYSGHVAGSVFAGLEVPELCVVMCPNHTGMGRPLAIMSDGSWETPLGPVPIASEFAISLKQRCSLLDEDSTAHRSEHAIEVELPFLQIRQPRLRLVPILRLDPRGLHDVVTQQHVSMCGFGPAVTMLTAVKSLGAASAELVKYATSGDISGDRDAVVGYAGIAVR